MKADILSEKQLQKNVIALLKSMDYTFIPQEQNVTMRGGRLGSVLLRDVLLSQLQKLNSFEYKGRSYPFSSKNIAQAIDDLDISLNEGLMVANQKISDQLLLGNSYQEEPSRGVKKSFSLKYIDFEKPHNNVFHFTEEFSVSRSTQNKKNKTRRPDIVLFVNGIPFGVVELKKSAISTEEGISQMIRNQGREEIPHLFRYAQILVAGNNHSPMYATTGTPTKFWATWEENGAETLVSFENYNDGTKVPTPKGRMLSKLDQTLYSLFEHQRALELLHSFILFDGKIKKMARYQQYFAIRQILNKVEKLDATGRREGGLIWHTQGSGKSLTMVMLTRVLKREILNSKVIVVTDRKDLDKQIHLTFKDSEIEAKRARSGHDLIRLLQGGKSVITTLIHKFETVKKEKVIIDDYNIFILVDESHRTQGGGMHEAMKKVFPSSCYLGFTGTPLMKREKSTIGRFGGLLHKYTIDQAVRDRAVLPLLYEGRLVNQWISDERGLDRRFERLSCDLNEEQQLDLKRKWARFQKVASSERRLEMIMFDINDHFMKNFKGTGFKAMLATSSKYEAIKYHTLFEEMGEVKTAFVISAPDSREGHERVDDENKQFINEAWIEIIKEYGDEESYLDKIKDEFVEGDEIDILIVVDKLLTGFDAPRATILYIDKELKEHNLLQAIARVNRLYEGKDFGFIVDYRGLLGNLDKALTDYSSLDGFDEDDLVGAVVDIREEIAKLKTFYSHLEELFAPIGAETLVSSSNPNNGTEVPTPKENGVETLVSSKNYNIPTPYFYGDAESYEVYLADEEQRKLFYDYLSNYARALKLTLSSDKKDEIFDESELKNYKSKMKFYAKLRASVKIRYHEQVDFGKYEKQMQKLLDTFISADDVDQLTKLVNIFDEDFESEIERIVGDNAKADAILSASTAVINEKMESNPAYYEKLSLRIREILEAYKNERLTEEEKLQNAKDIKELLVSEKEEESGHYPQSIESRSAKAFYDNIATYLEETLPNETKVSAPEFVEEEGLRYKNKRNRDFSLVIKIILKFDTIFKEVSKKPDWVNNSEVTNQIEGRTEEILWDLEDAYGVRFKNIDEIVAKVRNIGINNHV